MNVVFTGPSFHPSAVQSMFAGALVLPPIKRDDLRPFLRDKPKAIGIIDGEFYQQLAVSPKEILPFLDAGVRVYGASSMGALRAVELHRYGMVGVGRVFRLFRSGLLDADDEVALSYCPETYKALSEPLVNTRFLLRAAVRQKALPRAQALSMLDELKRTYFPERTRQLILRLVQTMAGPQTASRIREMLSSPVGNVKQQDARRLVERMQRDDLER